MGTKHASMREHIQLAVLARKRIRNRKNALGVESPGICKKEKLVEESVSHVGTADSGIRERVERAVRKVEIAILAGVATIDDGDGDSLPGVSERDLLATDGVVVWVPSRTREVVEHRDRDGSDEVGGRVRPTAGSETGIVERDLTGAGHTGTSTRGRR